MSKIILKKITTLETAEHPQREKYPDGTERVGFMWENTKPEVGKAFYVMMDKLYPCFKTSVVREIISETPYRIEFKTLNSHYQLIIYE